MIIPNGFRLAGVHCGLKRASQQEDLSLIVADKACVAAGVYTQNQIVAAPVMLDRQRTPSAEIRAVVINAGNANACTGKQGMLNAERMTQLTAESIGASPKQVLVMSTGLIGEQLPMATVERGIAAGVAKLGAAERDFEAAARGILTTDTKIKVASRMLEAEDIRIAGMAKGAGMIGPNMATMLGTILTDASLSPATAQQLLNRFVDRSFNAINVDGHTSTNDTVLLLATGQGSALTGATLDKFAAQLEDLCIDLAKQIVEDGEGATHLIEIRVMGARDQADARLIAKAIANSPLVKTAIAGNDPNWGRIVSAAGYAGPTIQVDQLSLALNGTNLYEQGSPVAFDAAAVSRAMQSNREVLIEMSVGAGSGSARFWTCDLTHEYVTINADYHT